MAGCGTRKKAMGGKINMKEGGSFPDLNKDGKVTQADILMGRNVGDKKKKMAYGGKINMKKGGMLKKRKRDGICKKGKTRGRMV